MNELHRNNHQKPPATPDDPPQVLEMRAAEQRRRLHNTVIDLRETVTERLDVKHLARANFRPALGVAAFLGLVFGYTVGGLFTG